MPSKPWFRVHTAILNSRKVQALPPPLFKWLVNFWAAAAGNGGILPPVEDLAWMLHSPVSSVKSAVEQLHQRNLLDESDGLYTPHDWADWQFESDSSTQRVKQFRERQRNVSGNATGNGQHRSNETPRVRATEQSRAEQKQSRRETVSSDLPPDADIWAESVCDRHPKITDRPLALQVLSGLASSPGFDRGAFDRAHCAWCATEEWQEKNGRFAPKLAEWIVDKGYLRLPHQPNGKASDSSPFSDYPEIKPGEAA